MKTIDIKGKPYVEVPERIKFFRDNYPDGQVITTMISHESGACIFKCEVFVDGVLRAIGHAREKDGDGFINKTSYVENCETSAVGRALGIFGIGIVGGVASAEEVANAIKQQSEPKTTTIDTEQLADLKEALRNADITEDDFCTMSDIYIPSYLEESRFEGAMAWLRSQAKKEEQA